MEVYITRSVPEEYTKKPSTTYETNYMYTGYSRYDTVRKVLAQIVEEDGRFLYTEFPCTDSVFSRVYAVEHVRVSVYSESPRVWKEELSPGEVFFYQQRQPDVSR
jgi:hypothetical protein